MLDFTKSSASVSPPFPRHKTHRLNHTEIRKSSRLYKKTTRFAQKYIPKYNHGVKLVKLVKELEQNFLPEMRGLLGKLQAMAGRRLLNYGVATYMVRMP
jgi:hypothetical protein